MNSWCIKNTDFSNSQVSSKCQKYWTIYYVDIAITLAISISVAVFKVILKFIVIGIARFQRYTDHTETIKNVMKNLTITYILTTVLITFLVNFFLHRCKPMSLTYRLSHWWVWLRLTRIYLAIWMILRSIVTWTENGTWILDTKYGLIGLFSALNIFPCPLYTIW